MDKDSTPPERTRVLDITLKVILVITNLMAIFGLR